MTTITTRDIDTFAALTGDHHPVHLDASFESPFGGRIAHGLLVLSRAVGELGFDPQRVIALRRVRDVVFKRPVRPDEPLDVSARMGERDPATGLREVHVQVRAQGRLALRAVLEVVWAEEDEADGYVRSLECVPL